MMNIASYLIDDKIPKNKISLLANLKSSYKKSYDKLHIICQLNKNDARLTMYGRSLNVIDSVFYCMFFETHFLSDKQWYKTINPNLTPSDIEVSNQKMIFDEFLTLSFVTLLFSSTESFIRVVMKELFPDEIKKDDRFKPMCTFLLTELNLKNYNHIFEIIRLLRNSLHNNGIITEDYRVPIVYRGKVFNFEKGKQMIVNWELLTKLFIDVEECLFKITQSPKLEKISYLKDPSYFEINFIR